MQSLRDKLLKAGLVSEDAAKKAEAEKAAMPVRAAPSERRDDRPPRRDDRPPRRDDRPPRRDDRPMPPRDARPPPPRSARPPPRHEAPVQVHVHVPKLPPMQGSKESHRLQARKQLELDKQLRELAHHNAVPLEVGATPFYFVTRKNKLRRMEMTPEQAKQLEMGELAVVERPDPDKIEHALVPPAIAEQMLALSERSVRFLNKEGAKVGFLTDEEINTRASEADAPAEPEAPASHAPPQTAAEPKPDESQTFITIKRSPLP